MGGDLVVVLVVRVAPEYGVLGAPGGCVVTVGQVLPGQLQPVEQPCHVDPEARAGLRLGDLADRLGGSGRSVVHQDVPSVGSATITSAMA